MQNNHKSGYMFLLKPVGSECREVFSTKKLRLELPKALGLRRVSRRRKPGKGKYAPAFSGRFIVYCAAAPVGVGRVASPVPRMIFWGTAR